MFPKNMLRRGDPVESGPVHCQGESPPKPLSSGWSAKGPRCLFGDVQHAPVPIDPAQGVLVACQPCAE